MYILGMIHPLTMWLSIVAILLRSINHAKTSTLIWVVHAANFQMHEPVENLSSPSMSQKKVTGSCSQVRSGQVICGCIRNLYYLEGNPINVQWLVSKIAHELKTSATWSISNMKAFTRVETKDQEDPSRPEWVLLWHLPKSLQNAFIHLISSNTTPATMDLQYTLSTIMYLFISSKCQKKCFQILLELLTKWSASCTL